MGSRPIRFAFRAIAVVILAGAGSAEWAQADTQLVQQVLDRVVVFNAGTALEMNFELKPYKEPTPANPTPVLDFYNYNLVESTRLSNCRLNGSRGLYCVDGLSVRRWQNPEDGGSGQVEFSCANDALRLDKNRTDICTALAVAQNGDVWIAGRRRSASVLIRLREKLDGKPDGSCRDTIEQSLLPAASQRYCFLEYTTSERPLISRLVVVEGEEAEVFDPGTGTAAPGVLSLDVRNVVTYYSMVPKAAPIDLVLKADWLLANKEVLQDLALLQTDNGATRGDATDNRVLVTTSSGRVLSRQTDAGTAPGTADVFGVPSKRIEGSPQCPAAAPASAGYGIAVSAKTGRVYVTDRSYCQVLALEAADANTNAAGIQFAGLVNVTTVNDVSDLTLATSNDSVPSDYPDKDQDPITITGEYPPDGATVAPGIVVDLQECKGTCKVITSGSADLLTLSAVQLNTPDRSRVVLFQIRNIPDCRYLLNLIETDPRRALCADYAAAVIGPAGKPGEQYLDVAQMLPDDIKAQFPSTGTLPPGLPPLLISPQYRAREDKDFIFGAVFAIPEPGMVFKETFEADFDVAGLTGDPPGDTSRCEPPPTPTLTNLLQWDVVTRVSEKYLAPGGPNGLGYVDTIVNSGCGTTKSKIGSFSLVAYGLEIAYDGQDDVFARLVVKLFQDLKTTQMQLACPAGVDREADDTTPASDPLTDAQCSTLNSVLLNAEDKLTKCVTATQQPKTSAVDQNCQAFNSQFSSYRSQLNAVPPAKPVPPALAQPDPANRIGELKARSETLWLVYGERFLPSVPLGGFGN